MNMAAYYSLFCMVYCFPVSYTHLDVYKRQGETYRLRIWHGLSQGLRIWGSMIEGEVSCGACLFDFSVLGSLTEKPSDLVQMRP